MAGKSVEVNKVTAIAAWEEENYNFLRDEALDSIRNALGEDCQQPNVNKDMSLHSGHHTHKSSAVKHVHMCLTVATSKDGVYCHV